MTKEQEKKLEGLRNAKQNYLNTKGTDSIEKKGPAKENFDNLVNASGKCWDEVLSRKGSPEERRQFMEKFKKEITE